MKEKFNPKDWLQTVTATPELPQPFPSPIGEGPGVRLDIELVVSRIEAAQTDITANYSDWRDIGFAFADELGEAGRDYFLRISRFYPKFSISDCNKQYDHCLKAKGQGVSIKTFFHVAKLAGIDVRTNSIPPNKIIPATTASFTEKMKSTTNKNVDSVDLPNLPESIFPVIPDFLQRAIEVADSKEERDILLLGALVAISACLPKVYGLYDGKKVYPNLYLFITAQASAGKGRLVHCKQLVKPVHVELREQARLLKLQYENEMREYNSAKGKDNSTEKPMKPPEKMLFIPANNSTTGVFQLLSDNEGKGLIFETEGDTLAQAFKTDYGNYSDGFRKAYHHETISYYRRTDREYVDIDNPCLSTVLSGTPKQVSSLIPNAENGLFSRFIFYFMNIKPIWKNVFASNSDHSLDEYFDNLGKEFLQLYKALNANPSVQFCLTPEQQDQFNTFFSQVQEKYLSLQGMDYMATIRRLGLIAFRIAMIFSALRILDTGDLSEKHYCSDDDFQSALSMISILVKHSSHVFSELPEDIKPAKLKNRKEQFLDKLPVKFNRQNYLDLARSLSIPEKTAEGYITSFCDKGLVFREQQNCYTNLSIADVNVTNKETQDFKETTDLQ